MSELPPDPLPPLDDYGRSEPGPYAYSELRSVTGSRINPHAKEYYDHRELCIGPDLPVTAAHQDLELWLANVGSFDPYLTIEQPPAKEWILPKIVPRVIPGRSFPPFDLPAGTYAIDYAQINGSLRSLPSLDWVMDLRSKFPPGSFLILDFIGNHDFVPPIWQYGDEFWAHPFMEQFDAVVMPEFSTFMDDPKPQYLIGERQKQIFAMEGFQAGKTVIPAIAWSSESSLIRQIDLIGSLYPKVNTVLLDLLGAGVDKTKWLWSRFEMVEKHIAHLPFRFIVSGATAGWAVVELHRLFPRGNFHLLHVGPYMNAIRSGVSVQQRAIQFRAELHRYEEWHDKTNLPKAMPKPEIPDDLKDVM